VGQSPLNNVGNIDLVGEALLHALEGLELIGGGLVGDRVVGSEGLEGKEAEDLLE